MDIFFLGYLFRHFYQGNIATQKAKIEKIVSRVESFLFICIPCSVCPGARSAHIYQS